MLPTHASTMSAHMAGRAAGTCSTSYSSPTIINPRRSASRYVQTVVTPLPLSCSSGTGCGCSGLNHGPLCCSARRSLTHARGKQPQTQRTSTITFVAYSAPGQAAERQLAGPRAAEPPATSAKSADRVGVLLLNLGGPEGLEDVQPFLYNLFADPDIIRLPPGTTFLQPLLAQFISMMRAPKSSEGYRAIGGGSPLRRITEEQATALEKAMHLKGQESHVYVGMRYWHPYTEEALELVKRDRITRLVILPLYPQFSISTSGSSLRLLESIFKNDEDLRLLSHTVIPSWYQRKGYVNAMVDLMELELAKFENRAGTEVFFSAHGVPKSYVEEAGDPYKEEMEECVRLIMEELGARGYLNHHTLAYQSRVGPAEWLQPYTDESIR